MASDVLSLESVKDVVASSLGCCRSAARGSVSYMTPLCRMRDVNTRRKWERKTFRGIKGLREGRDEVRSWVRIEVREGDGRRKARSKRWRERNKRRIGSML